LGLYWLSPSSKVSRRGSIDTVIIEEPEMGLHPQAIVTFGLLVLELLQRKYRVIVATHSPVILDLVWAIRELTQVAKPAAHAALKGIFGVARMTPPIESIFDAALSKDYRTYFFDRTESGVVTRDISSLDPGSDDEGTAGWGGLSGFSGRIAELVGRAISKGARA
jgi:AAA domain, putative AbiEii toxin, Type IV TA system